MVNTHYVNGEIYYSCSICGLVYKNKNYAELCEKHCSKHHGSCSKEISKYAIGYLKRQKDNIVIVFYEKRGRFFIQ